MSRHTVRNSQMLQTIHRIYSCIKKCPISKHPTLPNFFPVFFIKQSYEKQTSLRSNMAPMQLFELFIISDLHCFM